jgi:2-polyprenyl-6-methoxyphenol hydroxylase-like FAD-dependent oxidoreductase
MTAGRRLRIAMIGGGIGGLTAAQALRRRGVDVTVCEAAPELSLLRLFSASEKHYKWARVLEAA